MAVLRLMTNSIFVTRCTARTPTAVAKLEKAMIENALETCNGNRAEAARRLNIHRQLLYAKMQRYGLTDEGASATQTSSVRKADK